MSVWWVTVSILPPPVLLFLLSLQELENEGRDRAELWKRPPPSHIFFSSLPTNLMPEASNSVGLMIGPARPAPEGWLD